MFSITRLIRGKKFYKESLEKKAIKKYGSLNILLGLIFTKLDNGCKITDIIDYGLPFGLVGEFFHPIFIKPKLEEIFIYRNKKIKDLFGSL